MVLQANVVGGRERTSEGWVRVSILGWFFWVQKHAVHARISGVLSVFGCFLSLIGWNSKIFGAKDPGVCSSHVLPFAVPWFCLR